MCAGDWTQGYQYSTAWAATPAYIDLKGEIGDIAQ